MSFSINATDLQWIDGTKDNPEDLCLHGHVIVVIANRKIECDATISATAIYLLKSLTENHIIHQENQLLPCCGHTLIPNEKLDNVEIIGCDNGVDWSVTHNNNTVILELEDGTKDFTSIDDYKSEVFRFADMIEDFYNSCTPKVIPNDSFERDGYIAFWNEWHRRREL